jgi:O-antigen/teichoic acid export membrane protein
MEALSLLVSRATIVLQFGRSRRTQTILDQILVSGSNFVTGIILVRGLGLEEFGRFTVAYAILLLANSIQLSFISSPMITVGSLCSTAAKRRNFLRGMLGVQLIFCAIAVAGTFATAMAYFFLNAGVVAVGIIPVFCSAVGLYLLQDWLRRYYFTFGKASSAVWNDAVSYLGQVVSLCVLLWIGRLTIETAFGAIALTSGIAFVIGAALEPLGCNLAETRDAWRQTKRISIDMGIANQLQWLVYQGAILVGASVAGAAAAGGVRATQNVIGPVNMAYQAMENIVPIRAAEEMRRGGIQRATAFLFRFGATGFVALLVVFSAASLFSSKFLVFFYGHQLRTYASVLNLQMFYFLLTWPVRQLTFLFRTIKNTTPILIASIAAAVISMSCVYPMVRNFGASGIVVAAVAGQLGNLLYLVHAWNRVRWTANAELLKTQAN